VSEARNEVGAGRGDQHHLRPARELDVTHGSFRCAIPQIGAGGPARHRLKTHGRHEFLRRLRHHDLYVRTPFDQPPHQIGTLVDGNAAGDPQQYSGLRRQWMPFSSLNRAMSLSNFWRMVDSSLRFSRRFCSWVRMSLPTRTRSSAI